jgi:predicted permease
MNAPLFAITNFNPNAPWVVLLVILLIIVGIWDGVWKLIALWKSARNDQIVWFIFLAILNTAGILPILYILLFQRKPAVPPPPRM